MSTLKSFTQPQNVYKLEYPSEWENLQEDDGRSCGFGPADRDDVGLWISVMPVSIDTERMGEDLDMLFQQSLGHAEAANQRRDPTLRHYGLKADITKEGQGGHYWLLAGGDVVLFASSEVPIAERDVWNPLFDRVMASLQITRDDELLMRKAANEVFKDLKDRFPEKNFKFDDSGIRSEDGVVQLGNLYREVRRSPKNWLEIAKNFADGITQSMKSPPGAEVWVDVRHQIYPIIKPANYIVPNTATQHLFTEDWLEGLIICYAIKSRKLFRFLTGWDLNRWGVTEEELQKVAMQNLTDLPWPTRLEGSRQKGGGRIILVETGDDLTASRILHPDLHRLFSRPLGNPFWAGIPERSTLVVFSDRRALKKRIGRQLRKDFDASAHSISPRPLLVTADGIALGGEN